MADPSAARLPEELATVAAVFSQVRHEHAPASHLGLPGRALTGLANQLAFRRHVRALVAEAVALGERHGAEAVWAILDAPTSIAMAEPVARTLGKPLIALVWDDAAHLAQSLGLDRLATSTMLRHTARALKSADRCAVIGATMQRRYAEEHGTRSVILRHGLASSALQPLRAHDNGESVFSIGFAGTMNAPCAFNALLAALESCDWQIAGRAIELRLVGPRFDMRTNKPALFRSYGWRSVSDTIRILAGCDATYLPQPFGEDRRTMAELSFPTKLTTYLATGRPILLHAPPYASLPQYHQKQPLGLLCGSIEPAAIVAALEQLIFDSGLYASAAEHARQAYRRDFTEERFRGSFAELLGTTPASFSGVSA
ncbi:MAG: hypothetical protein VKK97_08655 [Synechococcaceae cyanobacterium]|nr:hypothetical protein [Synechococcaceae cyanobacterium]